MKIIILLIFVFGSVAFAGNFTYTNDASGSRSARSFTAQKMNPQGSDSLTKTMIYWDEIAGSGAKGYIKGSERYFGISPKDFVKQRFFSEEYLKNYLDNGNPPAILSNTVYPMSAHSINAVGMAYWNDGSYKYVIVDPNSSVYKRVSADYIKSHNNIGFFLNW
ncbi:MAG: hypothetical protein NT007_16325 [Candidatus Kapabacteria bacterium]|nr:hypothetical protein [Candidatus Kapabacteria bacterium]